MQLGRRTILVGLTMAVGAVAAPALAAKNPDKKDGILLDHVMVLASNPGFIIPCFKVRRNILNQVEAGASISFVLTLTYMSRGVDAALADGAMVTKSWTLNVADLQRTDHHDEEPSGKKKKPKWTLLDIQLDVSDAPPEDGAEFSGNAERIKDADCDDDSDSD